MIQRVQTIYLLLSSLSLALMFAFPISAYIDPMGQVHELGLLGLRTHDSDYSRIGSIIGPLILVPLLSAFSVWILLQYKNRKRQLMLGRLVYLVLAGLIIAIAILVRSLKGNWSVETELRYGPSYFLPIAAILFNFLAMRSIRRDENIVRSLDRLR